MTDNIMDKNKQDKKNYNGRPNTTQKTNDWATQTLLISGNELMCSGKVNTSFSASVTCRVPFVKENPMMSNERGKVEL